MCRHDDWCGWRLAWPAMLRLLLWLPLPLVTCATIYVLLLVSRKMCRRFGGDIGVCMRRVVMVVCRVYLLQLLVRVPFVLLLVHRAVHCCIMAVNILLVAWHTQVCAGAGLYHRLRLHLWRRMVVLA